MKELNDYMNYAFETYAADGKLINRINGPGYRGDWLNDLWGPPQQLAIIPAPFDKVVKTFGSDRCWRTVMIPIDGECNEVPGERIEAVMIAPENESEARSLAGELGCEIYYWSYWEETRMIVIVSSSNQKDYPESDDWWIYTTNDL